MNEFIIELPFEYKKAVLTQARVLPFNPYAFIIEFNDGSRKFMKGPFKNKDADLAKKHVECNDVKRCLESKYLHPIECEMKEYGSDQIFLECEELGHADLNKVKKKTTKRDGIFYVLDYNTNDFVPDPFIYINSINHENIDIWLEIIVNYCFRWVFGIKDSARRNLMLQRSTGKIYSVDETGIGIVKHQNIWNGKKPNRFVFHLIRKFVNSKYLSDVLTEVERWNNYFDHIRKNIKPLSIQVEGRINKLLNYPIQVFDVN